MRAIVAIILSIPIGLATGICGDTFVYAKGASYLTNDPKACANCHVMQELYDGWTRSSHRAVAVCNCHMPYKREGALKISDHHVRSPLLNINRACQTCHKWPEAELLALRTSWAYPGAGPRRRAYYRSPHRDGSYEPREPHQIPPGLPVTAEQLHFPRTGLPRDPYALRPRYLDTARGILDAALEALDRRLGGALTRDKRHRREPVRVVHPPET